MSRLISDDDLLIWEAYASAGPFGLPETPKIVFHCLTDPRRRARYIHHEGDNATAQRAVRELPDGALLELLGQANELD